MDQLDLDLYQLDEDDLKHVTVQTQFGDYNVYIQGNTDKRKSSCVLLTVHDIGCNHKSLLRFCSLPCMAAITARSLNVHICLPGQDAGSSDYGQHFPSMQDLSTGLLTVLEHLQLGQVVMLGVGAGANISCRLAMLSPDSVLGVVALKPTASAAGIIEQVKERSAVANLRLSDHGRDTDQFLVLHKFGHLEDTGVEEKRKEVEEFKRALHTDINPRNLKLYLESYMKRTDIMEDIRNNLRCDLLIIVGSKSSMIRQSEAMFKLFKQFKQSQTQSSVSLIKVDGVGDVLSENPKKVSEAILFFCQGVGMIPTVLGPRHRRLSATPRGVSMSSADVPNITRLSLCED